jgi:heat shock protein HslJ
MRLVRLSVLVLASVLLAAACGASAGVTLVPSTPGASDIPAGIRASGAPSAFGPIADASILAGRTFISTGHDDLQLVPGSRVRLTFRPGSLVANAGCNSMSGADTIVDSTLHLRGALASTAMACDQPLMDQDAWLAGFLGDAAMTFDGTTLVLTSDGVTLTLMDEEVLNPDRPIEGTAWHAESLLRDQVASSVPAGLASTLAFADGMVTYSGCNRGTGTAIIGGEGTITFGPLATTRMACPQPAMDLEAFVLGVLAGEVRATVDGDVLHLLGVAGGLDLRAQD